MRQPQVVKIKQKSEPEAHHFWPARAVKSLVPALVHPLPTPQVPPHLLGRPFLPLILAVLTSRRLLLKTFKVEKRPPTSERVSKLDEGLGYQKPTVESLDKEA